jgi:hypothetical protein
LVLQACMYRALSKLTPSPLLTLYHHAPLTFNRLLYSALYSYIDGCFNIFHSLTFSLSLLPPIAPSNGLTNTVLFSLTIYVYMYVCACVCVCVCIYIYIYKVIYVSVFALTYRSSFHIHGKTCILDFLSLTYLHLT